MTPSWLITRPAEEADEFAEILAARGHIGIAAPVLAIRPGTEVEIDLDGVQALLFTSTNGVRTFARLSARRDLPVLTVGDRTGAAARAAGFGLVHSAAGAAGDLVRLAERELDPTRGALWHGAGEHVMGELRPAIERLGFELRTIVLYRAVAASRLPPDATAALKDGTVGGVLFFSPRTAEVFVKLVVREGLADRLGGLSALCLSRPVALGLLSASRDAGAPGAAVRWARVRAAAHPDRSALLALLDDDTEGRDVAPEESLAEEPMTPIDSPEPTASASGSASGEATNAVIELFGGIRPMASKLGMPFTTVQGWKKRGNIPDQRHAEIAAAAERHEIALPAGLLASTAPPSADRSEAEETPSAPQTPPAAAPAAEPPGGGAEDSAEDQPVTSQDPPAQPVPPDSTRGGGTAWLAAAVAVLAAVASISAPWWAPEPVAKLLGQTPASAIDERIAALESVDPLDLTALEDRLASLEASAAGAPDIGALEDRLAAAEAAADDAAALAGPLDALAATAGELEAAQQALADELAALAARPAAPEPVAPAPAEPDGSQAAVGDLTARVDALGESVAALRDAVGDAAPREAIAAITDRLARLETAAAAVEALADRLDEVAGGLDALDSRLSASEALLETVSADLGALVDRDPLPGAETSRRLDQLLERVDRLDGTVGGLQAVRVRMEALETAQAANAMLRDTIGGTIADLTGRIDGLGADIARSEDAVDRSLETATLRLEGAFEDTRQALDGEVAAIRGDVDDGIAGLEGSLAAALDDAATRLAIMQAAIDELLAADTTTQAILLAVGQLQVAVERGQGFAPALATLEEAAADDPAFADQLDLLRPQAEGGVPTRPQLVDRFYPMAEAARAADRLPEDPDWVDRTQAAVEGLFSVRPVAQEASGDTVPFILARAEARIVRGDLEGAVDAIGDLTGPAADAAADWLADAQARLAAERALQVLTDEAVGRLTGPETDTDAAAPAEAMPAEPAESGGDGAADPPAAAPAETDPSAPSGASSGTSG